MGDAPDRQHGTWVEFEYDKRGFGMLDIREAGHLVMQYAARTGSINQWLELVKAIRPGIWSMRKPSVMTSEKGMYIKDPAHGWKIRLWTPEGVWSRYLIHPDGNKPGTAGCLGILNLDAHDMRRYFDKRLTQQPLIPVYINTPVEDGGYWYA